MLRGKRILAVLCLIAGWGATSPGWAEESELAPGGQDEEKHFTLPPDAVSDLAPAALPPPGAQPRHFTVSQGLIQGKTTLFSEGFEGAFPASPWNVSARGSADVRWGKSTYRKSSGNASAWCARSGTDFPGNGQDVPRNTESWMTAGPFDLSSLSSGELAFDLWLETETRYDFFSVGASLDGTHFIAFPRDQDTQGWERVRHDLTGWGSLGNLTGRSRVWFTFIYESDGSIVYEGAYVDHVTLSGDTSGDLHLVINQIDPANCPEIQAVVTVTDSQGDTVPGLTAAHFTLEEDGTAQTCTVENPGTDDPLAVALVLDGSGSLDDQDVQNVRNASNHFINLLGPDDQIAVYHFGTDVTLIQDYTQNKAAARAAVNALTDDLGFTSLFDAVAEAADHSTTVTGRRALVVMTDGEDNDSVSTQQEAIHAAWNAGVPVFTIGFGYANELVLESIANQTGGLFFQGATSADLQAILNRIGQIFGNQYLLTWTTHPDGQIHDVDVEVRRQGQTASGSGSYDQAGTPCAPCDPDSDTLCLNRGRFQVEVEWRDFVGNTGRGMVAPCGADDSGILWFFDPANWEMLVKVLDGCAHNHHYWVFFAATTNVGYTMTVIDTERGVRKVFTNPLGTASPAVTDTMAFATCP